MITTSTSQLIVTSAHYTAIAEALVRRIFNNDLIEVTLVSITLSMCTFCKKSATKCFMTPHFFALEIVDDFFRVSISKNLRHQCLALISQCAQSVKLYLLWRVFVIHLLSFLILRGVLT